MKRFIFVVLFCMLLVFISCLREPVVNYELTPIYCRSEGVYLWLTRNDNEIGPDFFARVNETIHRMGIGENYDMWVFSTRIDGISVAEAYLIAYTSKE